jgi:hypothetical protein
MCDEFSGFGKPQLVAFDESGDVRARCILTTATSFSPVPAPRYPPRSSRVSRFQRDSAGRTVSLTWQRDGAAPRLAKRVEIETREDVRFRNPMCS